VRKTLVTVIAIGLGATALGIWLMSHPVPAATTAAPPISLPTSHGPDIIRYKPGAPQLGMIVVQELPSSAVPVTDVLSSRIVYDEDATVRIGVGVSGRILDVKASIGDNVKAGQVLAEMDSPDFGTSSADLGKARADEARKRLSLERAKELVPGEAIPLKDYEAIQADYAQAHAETARAEQRLRNLNPLGLPIKGQRLKLTSPITGVVVDRSVTTALEVAPGMTSPLFVITDPRRLWLSIDLPERLLGLVKKGNGVEVESDAYPHQRFKATVLQLAQSVDPNTRRVTVRARLDNRELKLLPEMYVRAYLLQDSGTGVRVPNSAVVNQGVYNYVFVQTQPAEFARRKVTLLTQGIDSSYVGEGLQGNERVVTTGALLLDAELSARSGEKP
jgi:cobalt-zinc-cadmium efflux system membrane fusion protein